MNVLIRGALVVDGTGAAGRQADVAIADGRITSIGQPMDVSNATVIEGGLVLAPGFIDLHSHADLTLPAYPAAINSLSQGVTTEVVGNCGFSPAPVSESRARANLLQAYAGGLGPDLDWSWHGFAQFSIDSSPAIRRSTWSHWWATERCASRRWGWTIGRRRRRSST